MSEEKTQPLFRLSFSEKQLDAKGREYLTAPEEVAVAWPRKDPEKKGGLLDWQRIPETDGVYFFLPNQGQEMKRESSLSGKPQPSHTISFAQGRLMQDGSERLDRPKKVAEVVPRAEKQGGIVHWQELPQFLGRGAFFVLENERTQEQSKSKRDQFTRPDAAQRKEPQKLGANTQFERKERSARTTDQSQGRL